MNGINKVILVGFVGGNPQAKTFQNGGKAVNFSVATKESWKDKRGQKQENTEWHQCVAFGATAGIVEQYVTKGSRIYVEGSFKTNKWVDKAGQEQKTAQIVVKNVQLLGEGRSPENQEDFF